MKNIKINIKFPKASELQGDLNKVLGELQKKANFDLKIDTSSFLKSISDMTKALDNLKSEFKVINDFSNFNFDKAGSNVSAINKETDAIKNQINTLKEQQEILKRSKSDTIFVNGNLQSKELEKIRDEYGNIVETIKKYNNGNLTSITEKITNDFEKSKKEIESFNKLINDLQSKLNASKSNKSFTLIDEGVFQNLQTRLNSITTDTPQKEINELKNTINNLGSTDSQIVRLQNAILKYSSTITNLKDKYGNIVPKEELNQALSQINNIRVELENLQNGGTSTKQNISKTLNDSANSMKNLQSATKNASEQQRLYNKEVTSFSGAFKDVATKVGLFSITYEALNSVSRAFRDGIQSVIDMDSALANLNKVVDLSNSQLTQMRDSAVEMGKALGRSSVEVANAQAEFGRQYKDVETINNMVQTSILGANVMDGVSADNVAKGLTTIINSLKLEAKDAVTIIDSLNEVQNNYRVEADQMLNALAKVGSTASVAGASLQDLEGYITALTVSTGESGDEVGNALKSITSRIYKIGEEGINAAGKPEEMLKNMGVAVRNLEGEFRPLSDILNDLSVQWKRMSETEKIATAQTVAGVHRYNSFIALMNNYDMALEATATAMDSMGSATKENEIYLNSIEGRMASLKATTEGFWYNFIDSDMIKGGISTLQGFISVLDGIQNTFGSLGVTVGVLSTAFLTFTNNPLRQFSNDIVKHMTTLGGLSDRLNQVKAVLTQTGTTMSTTQKASLALKVGFQGIGDSAVVTTIKVQALQAALSFGIGLAITAVISAISSFVSSLGNADERIEEVNAKSRELADTLNSVNSSRVDLSSYEKINQKLEETNLSENERNDLNNQLIELKEKLYTLDDSAYSILNNENLSYKEQLDLLKQINDEKLRDKAEELDKKLGNGFWNRDESKNAEASKNLLENDVKVYREIIELQKQAKGGTIRHETLGILDAEQQVQVLNQLKESINENNTTLQRYNSNVELIKKANVDTDRSTIELNSSTRDFINNINNSTKAVDENTKSKQSNAKANSSMASMPIEDATKAYTETIKKTKELEEFVQKINEEQKMTPELITQIAEAYPEIGSRILSVSDTQEFLNQKIGEQVEAQRNAYMQMVENDNSYYNSKIKGNESLQSNFNQLLGAFITNSGEAYNTDLSNYSNLQELKVDLTNQYGEAVAELITNFVTANAEGYDVDIDNTVAYASSKAKILRDLSLQISKVQNQLANNLANIQKYNLAVESEGLLNEKLYIKNLDKLNDLNTQKEEIMTEFYSYNSGFKGYTPTFSGADFNSGSGAGGSGKSATEREVEDMQLLSDRYYDVDNALKKLNNELDRNKTLMKNASDEKRLQYLDKELQLLRQQKVALENSRKARQQELIELKKSLTAKGFNFDGSGMITNQQSRLDYLVSWANSTKNKDNQENVKKIAENLKAYTDLLLTDIPKITNEIEELTNTTIDSQKEIAEILQKQKETYVSNLEKETDALKKEIEKRKKFLNSQWEDEDYRDELKKKQDVLLDLNAQLQDAMRMADGELVANIKKQIESAQGEINDFIRNNERDEANNRFDEELNKLDENLQYKIDEINNKLSDEQILVLVQNGVRDLDSVLNEVNSSASNVTNTFASIGTIISEDWINSLDIFNNRLQDINGSTIDVNAITKSSKTNDKVAGGISISMPLIVEGNLTEDILPQVEDMIEDANRSLIKQLSTLVSGGRI